MKMSRNNTLNKRQRSRLQYCVLRVCVHGRDFANLDRRKANSTDHIRTLMCTEFFVDFLSFFTFCENASPDNDCFPVIHCQN